MRHGFIKTAAGTPKIQVADCVYNAGEILKLIRQMETEGAKIMEMCIRDRVLIGRGLKQIEKMQEV